MKDKTGSDTPEQAYQKSKLSRESTPERRRAKSDCHDLQPKYTPEQLEAVKKYVS